MWGIKSGNCFRLKLIPQRKVSTWVVPSLGSRSAAVQAPGEVGRGREASSIQWLGISAGWNALGVTGVECFKTLTKITSSFFFLLRADCVLSISPPSLEPTQSMVTGQLRNPECRGRLWWHFRPSLCGKLFCMAAVKNACLYVSFSVWNSAASEEFQMQPEKSTVTRWVCL